MNSCLMLLPMLHGRALITVEDLAMLNGGVPHPAQQAMVEHNGSQCGFCTPGMVMSLWAMFERAQQARRRPAGRRSPMGSPAISAGAPATERSSMPGWQR